MASEIIGQICKKFQKITAFTLAEVLIVIGIIGIVAEMTIPPLIANFQKQVYVTQLKKDLAILSQAYASIKSENISFIGLCVSNDTACLTGLFQPYLAISKAVSGIPSSTNLTGCWNNTEIYNVGESHVCYILKDGSIVDFDMEYQSGSPYYALISIDVNGLKAPNVWGKDRYLLYMSDKSIYAPDLSICNNGDGTWTSNKSCSFDYLYK